MAELAIIVLSVATIVLAIAAGRRGRDRPDPGAPAAELASAVAPLGDHLRGLEQQLARLERERIATHSGLTELLRASHAELTRLRGETGALVGALARPHVRGAWGEVQLRNVVRAAGMTERVDFDTQVPLAGDDRDAAGDDGRGRRPDMVVHLPDGGAIVVDAKAPLDAYLAAIDAGGDEVARGRELRRHAAQVRGHITALAGRGYQARLPRAARFVVCFIPNEACHIAALDVDPGLFEYGARRDVLLATPTTLLALLHATRHGWSQAAVEESAEQIAAAGRELHRRAATFAAAFAKIGAQLGGATAAYNSAVGSFDGRLMPQLRRLDALAPSERALDSPAALETAPPRVPAGTRS